MTLARSQEKKGRNVTYISTYYIYNCIAVEASFGGRQSGRLFQGVEQQRSLLVPGRVTGCLISLRTRQTLHFHL